MPVTKKARPTGNAAQVLGPSLRGDAAMVGARSRPPARVADPAVTADDAQAVVLRPSGTNVGTAGRARDEGRGGSAAPWMPGEGATYEGCQRDDSGEPARECPPAE